jgi:hypothetical protein
MIDPALIEAYHAAAAAYEAAKAGTGCRVQAFTRFLVAERILLTCLDEAHQSLERFRTRYSP